MERQTVGLMLPPAARTAPRVELSQQGSDTSLATSNLLRKRNQQIQRIDIAERPDKRPRANGQFRPPTPFPLEFIDCTRLLTAGGGSDMVTSTTTTTTTTTSSSPAPLSSDSVNSRTRYMPPPQLSEVINALTCLQESIALLSTKPGGPTPHELADLANNSCGSIVRDLRVVMATHADCVMRAEQHAREQLKAETVAFLHVSEH